MTFFVLNGDGAGPVSAQLDTIGKGKFTGSAVVKVATNTPGTNGRKGNTGNNAMKIVVPNTPCTNCLVRIKNPVVFGSCVKVNIVGAGGAAAAAPAAAAANQAGDAGTKKAKKVKKTKKAKKTKKNAAAR